MEALSAGALLIVLAKIVVDFRDFVQSLSRQTQHKTGTDQGRCPPMATAITSCAALPSDSIGAVNIPIATKNKTDVGTGPLPNRRLSWLAAGCEAGPVFTRGLLVRAN